MARATELQKRIVKAVMREMAVSGGDEFNEKLYQNVILRVLRKENVTPGAPRSYQIRTIRNCIKRDFAGKAQSARREVLGSEHRNGRRVGRIIRRAASADTDSFRRRHHNYAKSHERDLTFGMTEEQLGV